MRVAVLALFCGVGSFVTYNTATTLEYRYWDWIHKWGNFSNIKG